MGDVFYTILIAYVLWRIFGGTKVKTHVYHHHYSEPKKEGEVKVSKISKEEKKHTSNEGEYVDYEEVK